MGVVGEDLDRLFLRAGEVAGVEGDGELALFAGGVGAFVEHRQRAAATGLEVEDRDRLSGGVGERECHLDEILAYFGGVLDHLAIPRQCRVRGRGQRQPGQQRTEQQHPPPPD